MLAGGLSIWLYIIAAIILPETNAFKRQKKSGTPSVPDFVVSESVSPETRRGRCPHRPKGKFLDSPEISVKTDLRARGDVGIAPYAALGSLSECGDLGENRVLRLGHGLKRFGKERIELPAELLRAPGDHVARASGGKLLVLVLFLERL